MVPATKQRRASLESVLFYFLAAISILPVWTVSYFPSQDGPNHLWILHLLQQYFSSGPEAFGEWFEFNRHVEPNLGFYLVAYPLSLVFGVQAAEKLFLSIFVVVLCFGARHAVRLINPNAVFLSYLVLPSAFSLYVHMGFYNYLAGIALFMPALVFCIRQYQGSAPGRYWKVGAVAFLILLAHLLAFIMLLMALAAYITTDVIRGGIRQREFAPTIQRLLKEGACLTLVFIPSFAVIASFILRHGTTENPNYGRRYLVDNLIQLHMLVSFDYSEMFLVSIPYVILLVVLGILSIYVASSKDKPTAAWLPLLGAVLFMLVVYFTVPISTRGVPVGPRLVPFILSTGILWLAAGQWTRKMASGIPIACAVLVIAHSVLRLHFYAQADREIMELLSVTDQIESGSTVSPVLLDEPTKPTLFEMARFRARPLWHAGGYVANERNAIYLASLMAPSNFPYFPVVHQRNADPYALLGREINFPHPPMDFEAFERAMGRPVDYLVVIGTDWIGWRNAGPGAARSHDFVRAHYRQLAVSESGRYSLYQATYTAPEHLER